MSLLVADARLLTPGQHESIIVFGGAALGDGGGGIYLWDATAGNADDGENWLKPDAYTTENGRWRRMTRHLIERILATNSGTAWANTAADRHQFVEWTATAAKIFTIDVDVAVAHDTWVGFNSGGPGSLTLASGLGMTLVGNLVFAPLKGYLVYFTSSSRALVIGGSAS